MKLNTTLLLLYCDPEASKEVKTPLNPKAQNEKLSPSKTFVYAAVMEVAAAHKNIAKLVFS